MADIIKEDIKTLAAEIKECRIDLDNLQEITPAQFFTTDKAIITVEFLEEQVTEKGHKYAQVPYLIINDLANSTRAKVKLNQDELIKMGYFSDRTPDPQNRWSIPNIKAFLAGEEKPVTVVDIFDSIKALYKEFSDFGDDRISSLMSCWVMGTYYHRMFNAYPYLHLNGHLKTGKSKTIRLTTLLSFNGEMGVGNSASFLTRSINENCSTVGMDEAENLGNDDDSRTLIQMLNAGYKLGAMIGKSVPTPNGGWKTKRFDPYSPKIFGGIKRLAPTLNSRSIPITMLRSNDDKIINTEINYVDSRFKLIRDRLYIMAMTDFKRVNTFYVELQDTEIKGRDWELWKPIFALAKAVGENLYEELRKLAIEIQMRKAELVEDDTSFVAFLESLAWMIDQRNEFNLSLDNFYSTNHIEKSLTDESNPYREPFTWLIGTKKHGRWIGDELRKLGLIKGNAQQKKIDGKNQRGYELNRSMIEEQIKIYKV